MLYSKGEFICRSRVLMQDAAAVPGSRPGGKEESRAGEDQEPEEEVQAEGPGEH